MTLPVFSKANDPHGFPVLINIDMVRTNMLFFVFNLGEIKFEKE